MPIALPPKSNWTPDMIADERKHLSRPTLKRLDVQRYMLAKFMGGGYQINVKPSTRKPVRPVR